MENDNKRIALDGVAKSQQLLDQHKSNYEQAIRGAEGEQDKATTYRNAAALRGGCAVALLVLGATTPLSLTIFFVLLLFFVFPLLFSGLGYLNKSLEHNKVCNMFIHAATLSKDGIAECSALKDVFEKALLEEQMKENT